MFSAKILSVTKKKGTLVLQVEYTNGTETFQEEMFVASRGYTMDALKQSIQAQCDSFNDVYTLAGLIPVGTTINTTVVKSVLTPREEHFEAMYRLREVEGLVAKGVLTESDQVYIDAVAEAKSTYRAEYYGLETSK